jgi:spore coat-associated protein N
MSRFKVLKANPRRSLAALATVLVAVGVTGASGANFNAATANPANTFTAGTLTMSNSHTGAAILTAANMRPGDPATTGTVDIANTGSLSAPFTLTASSITSTDASFPMAAKLNLVITGGTVAQFNQAGHLVSALGTFGAAEKHTYKFSVALDSTADDNYQGDSATAVFNWSATS